MRSAGIYGFLLGLLGVTLSHMIDPTAEPFGRVETAGILLGFVPLFAGGTWGYLAEYPMPNKRLLLQSLLALAVAIPPLAIYRLVLFGGLTLVG
jgi:hypothetical protein